MKCWNNQPKQQQLDKCWKISNQKFALEDVWEARSSDEPPANQLRANREKSAEADCIRISVLKGLPSIARNSFAGRSQRSRLTRFRHPLKSKARNCKLVETAKKLTRTLASYVKAAIAADFGFVRFTDCLWNSTCARANSSASEDWNRLQNLSSRTSANLYQWSAAWICKRFFFWQLWRTKLQRSNLKTDSDKAVGSHDRSRL